MLAMIFGIALFMATHLLGIFAPEARAGLARKTSETAAKGILAVLTAIAIYVIAKGYQDAAFVNLWYPPDFLIHANNLLMVGAVMLFIAGRMESGIRTRVRHPQLASVKVWALAHLLVNGDLASLILFGSMLGWAVAAMIGLNRRDGAWERPGPGTPKGVAIHMVASIVILVVMMAVHVWAGVVPFPIRGG